MICQYISWHIQGLLDLHEALVHRFARRKFGIWKLPLREGAENILNSSRFQQQRLLQFAWQLDANSLRLWETLYDAGVPIEASVEWPNSGLRSQTALSAPSTAQAGGPDSDGERKGPQNVVILTVLSHVMLPSKNGVGIVEPVSCRDCLLSSIQLAQLRHPYGRAVHKAMKALGNR